MRKVVGILFLAGLVLLPFDSLPYARSLFREIGAMGPFYPLTVGILVLAWACFRNPSIFGYVKINEAGSRFAIFFLAWVFVSLAVNHAEISTSFFKGRSGIVKAALQTVLLLYCFGVAIYSRAATSLPSIGWRRVEKAILFSFIAPAFFSIIEVLYLYDVGVGGILQYIRHFISDNHHMYERARGVSGEPSYFAVYCAFLAPWLIRWLMNARGGRIFLPAFVNAWFVFIVILTFSRSAYIMVLVTGLVFLLLNSLRILDRWRALAVFAGLVFCSILFNRLAPAVSIYEGATVKNPVSTLIPGALDIMSPVTGLSTQMRLGAQVATFGVARERPVFGAGLGQAGFHMHKHVPAWVTQDDYEVRNWKDDTPGTPWAVSHGLHVRILAETGVPGLILWISIWVALGIALLQKLLSTAPGEFTIGAALVASVFGVALIGFNSDTLRFFEYWVTLGLSWSYLKGEIP